MLPSLLDYRAAVGKLPKVLTFSLAALLAFYRGTEGADGKWAGQRDKGAYPISDDADKIKFINECYKELDADGDYAKFVRSILARTDFWGQDLNAVPGLPDAVAADLAAIRNNGAAAAVKQLLEA